MSRGEREPDDAAYMELTPDAWHQNDEGEYYVDCPECGSAASLMNVVKHGRCNGYLDEREGETELDEEAMSCTAKLWLELGYTSDPSETAGESAVGRGSGSEDAREDDADGESDAGADPDYEGSSAPSN